MASETVALADAEGRTLAEPVHALTDLPAFSTSAMDGWAVCGEPPWTQTGQVLAGDVSTAPLHPGQAVAIATGAMVPPGADGILRTENAVTTTSATGSPLISGPARATDIRAAGEECRQGDTLAAAGTVIGPAHLGLFAAAGLDHVEVRRQPTVAIVTFGDEIAFEGIAPLGTVRDAIGIQLPGWLLRLGAHAVSQVHAPDSLTAHIEAIASARGDIVVTTGGTASGPVDHVDRAVSSLEGQWLIRGVAVRPGHPMGLATLGGRFLLTLPGNPQSALVGLLTLGSPLISAMLGQARARLASVALAADEYAPPTDHRLMASRLVDGRAQRVTRVGSAMLRGVAEADGFAVIPPGGATAHTSVAWLPLP